MFAPFFYSCSHGWSCCREGSGSLDFCSPIVCITVLVSSVLSESGTQVGSYRLSSCTVWPHWIQLHLVECSGQTSIFRLPIRMNIGWEIRQKKGKCVTDLGGVGQHWDRRASVDNGAGSGSAPPCHFDLARLTGEQLTISPVPRQLRSLLRTSVQHLKRLLFLYSWGREMSHFTIVSFISMSIMVTVWTYIVSN